MALDFPRSGSLHGATAVDYQCHRQAAQAGMEGGSFRALLAHGGGDGGRDANLESAVRFRNRGLPVVNAKVRIDVIDLTLSPYLILYNIYCII